MFGSNILVTEKIVLDQVIMCNKKLNKNYVSTRVRLYEILQTIPRMSIPPDPDWLVEELNCTHFTVLRLTEWF